MKVKKGSAIPAIVTMMLAILAITGIRTFAGPCVHGDGTFTSCYWAGRAVCGLSVVIAAESLLVLWRKDTGLRRGLYLAEMLTAVLGILMPGTLISLCSMESMRCRMIMFPAMVVLFSLMLVSAAVGVLLTRKG